MALGIDSITTLRRASSGRPQLRGRGRGNAFRAPSTDSQIQAIDWSQQMDVTRSIAVSATLSRSKLTHGHFAALRVKDAIVDQFRERCGERRLESYK